eukprot:s866_g16.t5
MTTGKFEAYDGMTTGKFEALAWERGLRRHDHRKVRGLRLYDGMTAGKFEAYDGMTTGKFEALAPTTLRWHDRRKVRGLGAGKGPTTLRRHDRRKVRGLRRHHHWKVPGLTTERNSGLVCVQKAATCGQGDQADVGFRFAYLRDFPKIDFLMLSAGRIVKCVVMSAAAVGLVAVCSNLKALENGKDANLLSAAEALVEVSLLSPSNSSSVAPRSFATSPSTSEAQKALETVLATTRAPELWTSLAETGTTPKSPRTPASKADTIAVMLAMQRSGTNFLAVELSRHPCIDLQHELFNDLKKAGFPWSLKLRQKVLKRFLFLDFDASAIAHFPENTQDILSRSLESFKAGVPVRGFNWKLNQDFLPAWGTWLPDLMVKHRVRLIWVQRNNLLRRIFSNQANKKTRTWGTRNESVAKTVGSVKVQLDEATILEELQKEEEKVKKAKRVVKEAKRRGLRVLTVYYENVSESLSELRNFLLDGTSCAKNADAQLENLTGYSKIHTKPLQDSIENFEQLRRKLLHTKRSLISRPRHFPGLEMLFDINH